MAEPIPNTFPALGINDHTLDDNLPPSNAPPKRDPSFSPIFDLGVLDRLPLELLHSILLQLDLQSIDGLKSANRRAYEVVRSLPQLQVVRKYARNALRAAQATQASRWILCTSLYETLFTTECSSCGDFGTFLYIVTCHRVCYRCLTSLVKYLPLRYKYAAQQYGLDRSTIKSLPQIRTIPGVYSANARRVRTPVALVDRFSAYRAGIGVSGEDRTAGQMLNRRTETDHQQNSHQAEALRFAAVVSIPAISKNTKQVEWGFYCEGCRNLSGGIAMLFRRKFTSASFKRHLEEFGEIHHGMHIR